MRGFQSRQCAIVFRKDTRANVLWLLEITAVLKRNEMHYVSLITHQSDTKICTANFSTRTPVNESKSFEFRSLIHWMCAQWDARWSHFHFHFHDIYFCPLGVVYDSHYINIFIAHIDTVAGVARRWLPWTLFFSRKPNERKNLFKVMSWFEESGKSESDFLPFASFKFFL